MRLFLLQRILQSNQIAERAIRLEMKWRRSKNLSGLLKARVSDLSRPHGKVLESEAGDD